MRSIMNSLQNKLVAFLSIPFKVEAERIFFFFFKKKLGSHIIFFWRMLNKIQIFFVSLKTSDVPQYRAHILPSVGHNQVEPRKAELPPPAWPARTSWSRLCWDSATLYHPQVPASPFEPQRPGSTDTHQWPLYRAGRPGRTYRGGKRHRRRIP